MDHRTLENFYLVVSPGLEDVCAAELTALEIKAEKVESGGIAVKGYLRDLYQANLWLRTASRVLVRFGEFRSRDFPELYRRAQRLPWGRFVRPETSVSFRVTCHESRLNHTGRIAETLESSLNQALGRSTNPAGDSQQLILVRIVDDLVTLSVDSSGELLHRRGYRQTATRAPLRETLAAGILTLLDWHGAEPLADPMCGSGSFLLEGALMATHQAPGLNRSFAFMDWPGYRAGLWKLLCDEARREKTDLTTTISGADEKAAPVAAATVNGQRCGVADQITIAQRSLSEQPLHQGRGLLVCNPPYGKRLSLGADPVRYYAELGRHLQRAYPDWRKAMLCPSPAFVKATGLPFEQIASLDNGGLTVGLYLAKPK